MYAVSGSFRTGFFAVMMCLVMPGAAQGVLITDDGTTTPDASAMLEMKSTEMGFLPPTLTLTQIQAISSPAAGLLVYNLSSQRPVFYDGSSWVNFDGSPAYVEVGDSHQGGIVFQVDSTGVSGKIAATADLGKADWGCQTTDITSGNGASSRTDGAANTQAILTDCSDAGIAAELCDDYSVVDNGTTYDDWYLPAVDELLALYAVHTQVGGFDTTAGQYYYSSTEQSANPADYAKRVSFNDGAENSNQKEGTDRWVRPIRQF